MPEPAPTIPPAEPPQLADIVADTVAAAMHTGAVNAMRRGHSRATEDRAYGPLAHLWDGREWARTPVLRYAAMAATYPRIKHRHDVSLGHHLAKLAAHQDGMSKTSVERRLMVVQNSPLEVLHQHLRSLLSNPLSEQFGLNWRVLAATYLEWDHKNRDIRTRTRRRLLEDFSQQAHKNSTKNRTAPNSQNDPGITPEL